MSEVNHIEALKDFYKCVHMVVRNGRVTFSCRLGLWEVEAPQADFDQAKQEAKRHYRQCLLNGDYDAMLERHEADMAQIRP